MEVTDIKNNLNSSNDFQPVPKVERSEKGENKFYHKYIIKPFKFSKFLMDRDRYSITVLAKENNVELKNFIQYILNSVESCSEQIKIDENTSDITHVKKQLCDLSKTCEELRQKWAIIDCSKNGIFKDICDNVISLGSTSKTNWLINHNILKCNNPNFKLKFYPDTEKNFSHIIWLTDDIVSKRSLLTNSILTFILDNDLVDEYMAKVINSQNFKSDRQLYYVFEKLVNINEQILTISKARFSNSN